MKLDSNIQTRMHGTAFTAMHSNITNRTNKELSEEQIILKNESNNIIYKDTDSLEDNSSLVAFKDPTNDMYVILSLGNDTISKLKSHFDKDDFYKRDDGIIRLDNKAEAYVSSWFGDIAYKRGFLEADNNNDGKLNHSEYQNTRNDFAGHGMVGIGKVDEYIDKSYVKPNEHDSVIVRYNNKDYQQPKSISEELDTTLNINNNFNDSISLRESYNTNKNNIGLSTKKIIEKHVNEAIHLGLLDEDLMLKLLKDEAEKENKKLEALQKLKQTNGDISQLSKEEKELITTEIEKSKKEDENIDKDKLQEIINYNKTSKVYTEIEASQSIGKYYEEKG